jgi:hypothetical protein
MDAADQGLNLAAGGGQLPDQGTADKARCTGYRYCSFHFANNQYLLTIICQFWQ